MGASSLSNSPRVVISVSFKKRNPMAKELSSAKYRKRVVKSKKVYDRKKTPADVLAGARLGRKNHHD